MKYLIWTLLWPVMFAVGLLARLLSPIACLFIVKNPYGRDILAPWLSWFDTFDNPTDEYWYGAYPLSKHFTQTQYDNSAILRWFMRLLWLQRNAAYGFNYSVVGIAANSPLAWQYQAHIALCFGYYNNVNIGWKAHHGFAKLMYAGRILGLRKYTVRDNNV